MTTNTDYTQLSANIKHAQVMSNVADIAVEIKVLETVVEQKKIHAIELGAGAAGWPKVLHSAGIKNVQWELVENFEWTGTGYDSEWPTNISELSDNIAQFDNTLNVSKIYDNDVSVLIESDTLIGGAFDLLRIDCDISIDEFNYLVTSCLADDALVFIDDSKTNCGMYRVMLGAMMVTNGLLYPVWFGEKEALYCADMTRARELGKLINDRVNNEISYLHANMESKTIFDKHWLYTTTTEFEIFVPNKDE